MRLRPILILVLLASFPGSAFADMSFPGFSRVPHDFVFEVEANSPGYRFWLVSPRGVEPLDLAPGRPFRVDGEGRHGERPWAPRSSPRPIELVNEMGEAKFAEMVLANKLTPGVIRSEPIDFHGSVPFYDSRERVIDRYRVEVVPGQRISLVWLGQNAGSGWIKIAWAAAGIFFAGTTVWAGWWVFRRMWRVPAGKTTA